MVVTYSLRLDTKPFLTFLLFTNMSNIVFSRQIDKFNAHVMLAASYDSKWEPKQPYLTVAKLQERLDYWREMHLEIAKHESVNQKLVSQKTNKLELGLMNAKRIRWTLEITLEPNDPRRMQLTTLFKEINNSGTTKKSPENATVTEPKNKRSQSKRAFTDRIDQFTRLSALLDDTSEYVPEVEELSIANWKKFVNELIQLREVCQNAEIEEGKDRILLESGRKELSKLITAIKRYETIMQLKKK